MLNKLIFAHKVVLEPLLKQQSNAAELERALDEMSNKASEIDEKLEVLASLNASGIVSAKTSFEEHNKLQLELKKLQEKQQNLINSANGKSVQRIELEELYRFTKRSNMLTEWEELLFPRFADQVIVYNRQEVGFKLKCWLILKERLPE